VTSDRFHGRVENAAAQCSHPGCNEAGEFRAPAPYGRTASPNGPGDYQWLCLAHVRAFNARYDYFTGMSQVEIDAAQSPISGWATESRAFTAGGVDVPPPWSDFSDPLEAISGRFRAKVKATAPPERKDGLHLTREERDAVDELGVTIDAGKVEIRRRYTELARALHPDRNGGDRSSEARLQRVVQAYQLLRKSVIFK
jgi:DnaJ domain